MERGLLSQIIGRIIRAQDVQAGLDPVAFSRQVQAGRQWAHLRHVIPVSAEIAEEPVAVGQIWQGGWVVPCPLCGAGLEYGDPEQPLTLCCSCWHATIGGRLLHVEYPHDWHAIEAILLRRPDGKTRGWLPGESTEQLMAENRRLEVD